MIRPGRAALAAIAVCSVFRPSYACGRPAEGAASGDGKSNCPSSASETNLRGDQDWVSAAAVRQLSALVS